MADQQPGDATPAAGLPEDGATSGATSGAANGATDHTEPATVHAPMRWSGSAVVPPPVSKQAWWSRRRPAAERPAPASDDPTDWATTPPVDPWAGHDTPWDPLTAVPAELPPAGLGPGRTAVPAELPPTRLDPGLAAPRPTGAAPTAPAGNAPPPRRRWGRRRPHDTAVDRAAVPGERPAHPATLRPPAATPARPATPGTATAHRRPADRPPVPASWRPPAGPPNAAPWPVPAPPRRRRRWPRRLAIVTLLGVVCCCGIPAGYLRWVPAGQFPVTAVLPQTVADLSLRDDSASRRAVARLKQQLRDAKARGDVFAGVYGDGAGKRVTIFGTTGLRVTPKADVEAEVRRLADQLRVRDVHPYDLGETGVHERCGVGTVDGSSVVVCAWADHGSLGTVLATRRSIRDSAELTGILRSAVLTSG